MPFTASDGQGRRSEVVWSQIAPCEHLVHIYEDDTAFLDSVEGFVSAGLDAGDGVVVIATIPHLGRLDARLLFKGFNLDDLRRRDRYIPLIAERRLETFMVNGWFDEARCRAGLSDVLRRAGTGGRHVRAFGEMVALLWSKGHTDATVRLEQLWHSLCQTEGFSLLCTYPRAGFAPGTEQSLKDICAAHTKVLAG